MYASGDWLNNAGVLSAKDADVFVCVRSVTLTFETFNITPYKTTRTTQVRKTRVLVES